MDAIPTRLLWDGRSGFVRHDGVQMALDEAPLGFAEVDYTPGCACEVRPRPSDPRREMHQNELEWCWDTTRRVAAAAKRTYEWMSGKRTRPEEAGPVTIPAPLV